MLLLTETPPLRPYKLGICRGKCDPEQHCHSEPVLTLVWESPSNFGLSIVIQTALFVPFSGTLPREVVLLTRRLPHQSEDWFAMTGNSPNSNLSVCCGKQIYKSIIFAGRRNSPGILLLYAMLFSLPGLLRAARRHSSVFHGLFSVSPTFT